MCSGHLLKLSSVLWFTGGAVIVTSPTNQTRQEASQAVFACEGRAMPANFSLRWLRDGVPVERHSGLERRFRVTDNGTLIIDPVAAEDAGLFTCEVSNGIGEPQRASAFLDVQCKLNMSIMGSSSIPSTVSFRKRRLGMVGNRDVISNVRNSCRYFGWLLKF